MLVAAVVGAALGVIGVAPQALVRNSLADPCMRGITPGASLGAVLVMASGSEALWLFTQGRRRASDRGDPAAGLGIDVHRLRRRLLVVTSLIPRPSSWSPAGSGSSDW